MLLVPQGDCYKPHVVNKRDEQYSGCPNGEKNLLRVGGRFEKEDPAETGEELCGMNDGPYVQALQGVRAGTGYLRWSFTD